MLTLLFACAWMIVFALYSHTYPIRYSVNKLYVPISSPSQQQQQQQQLHNFENGVPKLNEANSAGLRAFAQEATAGASADNIPVFYNLFVNNEADATRVTNIVTEQFNK